MSGRKMEGNEQQKRAAARAARLEGKEPSEVGATTGSSKQRQHLDQGEGTHRERLETRREGKHAVMGQNTGGHAQPRPGRPDRDTY